MSKKIDKVREDIRKAQQKLKEDEEYLKTLKARERQLEDEEIISQIRSIQGKGTDVLEVLRQVTKMKKTNEFVRQEESEVIAHE